MALPAPDRLSPGAPTGERRGLRTAAEILGPDPRAPREEAAQRASQIKVTRHEPSYPGGFGPGDAPLEEIPNYEKLTSGERWVMDFLPGVADHPVIGAALGGLAKFGETKFGRWVFDAVDYLALGTERIGGVVAQFDDARRNDPAGLDEMLNNVEATWYASSMAYDVADIEGWEGPGISGLVKTRKRIIGLMDSGMEAREALVLASDEMMEDAGALALRMQMKDALGHVLLDPLNLLGLWLKPLQGMKAKALANLTLKSDEVIKSTFVAEAVLHLDDLTRAGASAKKIEAATEGLRRLEALAEITPYEQFIVRLFGGTPTLDEPGKWGKIFRKINPLGLTPQTRAISLATKAIDNIASWAAKLDPVDAANLVQRVVDGSFDPRIAHMVATIEGQTTRGVLILMGTRAADLGEAWKVTTDARAILRVLANSTGSTSDDIMRMIFEADEVGLVLQKFSEGGGSLDDLALFVAKELGVEAVDITGETLAKSLTVLSDTGMATKQGFQALLMESVAGSAARFTVGKFGVQSRGFLAKLANSVKSAESLAFLRANPGYLTRNVLNNEFTMIARGVWGEFNPKDVAKFWDRVGFEPARLRSGISVIGEEKLGKAGSKALQTASNTIQEVAEGKPGALDKIASRIRDVKLGPLDMQALSAKAESGASVRAYTRSAKTWWRKYRKPLRIKDFSPQLYDDLASDLGTTGVRRLEKRLADAMNEGEIDDILKLQEITPGYSEVVEAAERHLGTALDDIIPDGELEMLTNKIIAGFEEGGTARATEIATREFDRIGAEVGGKVDDAIRDWTEATKLHVEHEGPIGALHQWANSNADLHNGAQALFAVEQSKMAAAIRSGALGSAKSAWRRWAKRSELFWKRTWQVIDGRTQAIEQGLKSMAKDDYRHVEGLVSTQRAFGKNWKSYFSSKNKRFDKFFNTDFADDAARQASWKQMTEANQIDYARTIEDQAKLMQEMDDIMVRLVPPALREGYMSGRGEIRKLTDLDQQMVLEFYAKLRGADLPGDEIAAAQNALQQKRLATWEQIADMEKAVAQALRGDQVAVDYVSATGRAQNNAVQEVRKAWQALIDEGDVVGGEAAARLTELRAARKTAAPGDDLVQITKEIDELEAAGVLNIGSIDAWMAELQRATKEGIEILTEGDTDIMHAIDNVAATFKTDRAALIDVIRRAPEDGALKVIDLPKDRASAILGYDAIQPFDMVGGHVLTRRGDWLGDGPMFYLDKIQVLSKRNGAGSEAMMEMFQEAIKRGKSTFYTSPLSKEGDLFWKGLAKKGLIEPVGFEKVAAGPLAGQNAPVWRMIDDVIMKPVDMESLPPGSFGDIFGNMFEQSSGLNQLWHVRGQPAMDALVAGADDAFGVKVSGVQGMSPQAQSQVQGFANAYKGRLSSDVWAMQKFGEWGRDSALLNYNMRLNIDAWAQNVMPYEFWTLHSIARWGMHSIDRPAAVTMYLRSQRFLEEGFRPEQGLPQRLKGHIRIKAPWLPKEWQNFLGDELFVNPVGGAIPFKQWGYAVEQIEKLFGPKDAQAERMLLRMLQDDDISTEVYEQALDVKAGEAWDRAVYMVSQSDRARETNALDVASTISSIHAPLLWAHYLQRGEKERISPFLPITRTIKGVTALLGIQPNSGGLNIEGALRRQLGLPAFDEWEDYRANRMLANMVVSGDITADEAQRAMLSRKGQEYDEAVRRAGIEYGVSALGSVLAIPTKAYPPGEEHLRKLKDDYQLAYKRYEGGDDQALQSFYEVHPEYEARQLALTMDPEQQLQRYIVDELWDKWNNLPVQHKREVADGLGTIFTEAFLNKETRSLETIPLPMMQYWAIVMGSEKPGEFHWDADKQPIELTDPADAKQLEAWYITRQVNFRYRESVAPLLDVYYDLEPGAARKQYKRENPAIQGYFDFRRDFMQRNPHLAPYIEDDPKRQPKFISEEARAEVVDAAPTFTWVEWTNVLGQATTRLFVDAIVREGFMDIALAEELEFQAAELGMTTQELSEDLRIAYEEATQ